MTAPVSRALASPVFWRHRPYFDLKPPGDGAPIAAYGPLLAYQNLERDGWPGTQHSFGERFRVSLLREAQARGYGLGSPLQMESELRTAEWTRLCSLISDWQDQPTGLQTRICRLLTLLCFHRMVLKLVPAEAGPDPENEELTFLAFSRAFAEYILARDRGVTSLPGTLRALLHRSPARSAVRFSLAMLLLNDAAKVQHDLQAARAYRHEAQSALGRDVTAAGFTDFADALTISRFFRGASFVPYLAGDQQQVVAEMDIAEAAARAAADLASDDGERLLAREALLFVTESRMREAQWLGARDLWLCRAQSLVELDPWGAKAHIELGEALFGTGDVAAAEREYTRASRLGPPGTAVAHYLAAQCRERLGDAEGACDAYYHATRIDPFAKSAAEGLVRTAGRTGQRSLAAWAADRLAGEPNAAGQPGDRAGALR